MLSGRTLAQAGRYAATLQVHAQLRDAPPFFVVDAPSWLAAARVTLPYDKQEYATLAGNQLVFAQQSAVRELWVVKNFAKK